MNGQWHANEDTGRGRVLVVDDNRMNRSLLEQELQDEGFEVRCAASGTEGIEVARAWRPEVILLDIQMPEVDGVETCRRIKSDPEIAAIPILFLTAHRTNEARVVEALRAGGNDFVSKPCAVPILVARVSCQVEIHRARARLERLAMTDELTGVYSRRFLFDSLRKTVKSASRSSIRAVSCLVVDIDHFKHVNDQLGHIEGDLVLTKVANTLASQTRETDVVARFGGEEFVVVLPNTNMNGAEVVGRKIRTAVEELCRPVTVSVGAACIAGLDPERFVTDLDDLIRRLLAAADSAMYDAKQRGRNRVVLSAEPIEPAA